MTTGSNISARVAIPSRACTTPMSELSSPDVTRPRATCKKQKPPPEAQSLSDSEASPTSRSTRAPTQIQGIKGQAWGAYAIRRQEKNPETGATGRVKWHQRHLSSDLSTGSPCHQRSRRIRQRGAPLDSSSLKQSQCSTLALQMAYTKPNGYSWRRNPSFLALRSHIAWILMRYGWRIPPQHF